MSIDGGICLVFDMRNPAPTQTNDADQLGQWYVWGSEDQPLTGYPMAATTHNGGPEPTALQGRLYWIDDTAIVRYETEEHFYDDASTAILTRLAFAAMSLAQLQQSERIYRVQANGRRLGTSTQRVTALIVEEEFSDPVTWTDDIVISDATNEEFEFFPDPSRATAVTLTIEEVASGQLTEGWAFKTIGFEVGIRGSMRKLGSTQQIGDE